jgi:hypothetical protein
MAMKYDWTDYSAADLGLNGVALNASHNSNPIDVRGADLVTFRMVHVNNSATAITGNIQSASADGATAGNWEAEQTRAIAGGVETLSDRSFSKSVSGDKRFSYPVENLNVDRLRLQGVTGTGGAASDTLTVTCRVRRPL